MYGHPLCFMLYFAKKISNRQNRCLMFYVVFVSLSKLIPRPKVRVKVGAW